MNALPAIAIFGPTGIGKTDAALELADLVRRRTGRETILVSADAYAVYREIPIISGAPQAGDWLAVGSRSVTETWSAGEFAEQARSAIDSALADGQVPIIAGGTGLYLQAALSQLPMRRPVPDALRSAMEARLAEHGPQELHKQLEQAAPEAASRIADTDSHRIIRALEAVELGDDPLPGNRLWTAELRQPTTLISLTCERAQLRERIDARVDAMIKEGAEAEVERAWDLGPSRTAAKAIGMDELKTGDADRMKIRTWQFARRQWTWAGNLAAAAQLDVGSGEADLTAARIFDLLGGRTPS